MKKLLNDLTKSSNYIAIDFINGKKVIGLLGFSKLYEMYYLLDQHEKGTNVYYFEVNSVTIVQEIR